MKIAFDELYGPAAEQQVARYDSVVRGFEKHFGDSTGVSFFSAPGRTEVGGNHTDHNHGKVLAAAINLDIIAAAKKTDTGVIRLKSAEYEKIDVIDTNHLEAVEAERETSASVIRGICAAALHWAIRSAVLMLSQQRRCSKVPAFPALRLLKFLLLRF